MPESDEAKRLLADEVKEAEGDAAARRARGRLDRADPASPQPKTIRGAFESSGLLIVVTLALVVMVGVVAALVLDSWWILAAVVVVHGIITTIVVGLSFRMAAQEEKPDPVTEARLEAEGVANPERELDDLVDSAADEKRSS
jgi:Flp pilus assembly protein TadB